MLNITWETMYGYTGKGRGRSLVGQVTYALRIPVLLDGIVDELEANIRERSHREEVRDARERAVRKLRAKGAELVRIQAQGGRFHELMPGSDELDITGIDDVAVRRDCAGCGRTAPPDGSACPYCGTEQ